MSHFLPDRVSEKIVSVLFAEAQRAGWEGLGVQDRSKLYSAWVQPENPVGSLLLPFMTAEEARVWIKDGPMKEYVRASNGVGKFARHIKAPRASQDEVLKRALGAGWSVVSGSLKTKPMRAQADSGEETIVFTWGPARDLKHLVWAALQARADGDIKRWVLVVVDTVTNSTPSDVQARNHRVARSCGLEVIHVRE